MSPIIAVAALSIAGVCAHDASPPAAPTHAAVVQETFARDLPNVPGKRFRVVTVTYPPGAASRPHRHDAFVFAYVLSGRVRSRVDDEPVRVYAAGESWHEIPGARHVVSENASATEPATFLAVFVADPDAALSTPER